MVIHYAVAHGVYYCGIGDFLVHISLWAVEQYLKDMTMFKRRVRNWARVGFGFVDGAVKRNRLLVKKLLKDGWFLHNPWVVCGGDTAVLSPRTSKYRLAAGALCPSI
jgi:hypothetical protein